MMFSTLPVMIELHEMLWYLMEAREMPGRILRFVERISPVAERISSLMERILRNHRKTPGHLRVAGDYELETGAMARWHPSDD